MDTLDSTIELKVKIPSDFTVEAFPGTWLYGDLSLCFSDKPGEAKGQGT